MRCSAALLAALPLAVALAGCTSPFTNVTTSPLPEVRAAFARQAYDSDGNGRTDGIAITLLSARPPPPLVGSDAVLERNGDTNVTTWRCAEREAELCESSRGILSWDVGETIHIRGLAGVNRLQITVRERFVYNTTLRVDETRDTEVWAVMEARAYDSNGNGTDDGVEISLLDSDKAPFEEPEVRVLVNEVEVPLFRDPRRLAEFDGSWARGTKLFVDGFIGENRVEVFLRATRFEPGTFLVGE